MKASIVRIASPILLGTAAYAAATLVAALAMSCDGGSDDDTTTTGKRITLGTEVKLAKAPSFDNAMGWHFELTKAELSVGPLYYFDGYPIESASLEQSRPSGGSVLGLLGGAFVGVAHAHPGHYQEGTALGEMLEPSSVDLVQGSATLADADAVTGTYRSVRFTFQDPPAGPLAADLGSDVIVLEGTATKGPLTKIFRFSATGADALDASSKAQIEGCTFTETDVEANGTVTMTVDPEVWLDLAELDGVPDSTDGNPVDVPRDDRAFNAFLRGIKKATAFVFTYQTP